MQVSRNPDNLTCEERSPKMEKGCINETGTSHGHVKKGL
jgi:hypothetical protein